MTTRVRGAARALLAGGFALVGLALVGVAPAAAVSLAECTNGGGKVAGDWVGTPTLTAQPDGSFAGTVDVRVYCKVGNSDSGNIPNAVVTLSTSVPNATINGQALLTLTLPTGQATVTIRSTDPLLAGGQWSGVVGQATVSVSAVDGQTLTKAGGKLAPYVYSEPSLAQTPELSSVVLFGSGALGMAGYALARVRGGRRRRTADGLSPDATLPPPRPA